MSFKGKVTSKKEIDSLFGKIILTTTQYEEFVERKKIIWGMCAEKFAQVGTLITTYYLLPRDNELAPVKYEPLYYTVTLTDDADSEHAVAWLFPEPQDEYEFDSEDDAMRFIKLLKIKGFKHAGIIVDTQTEFKRWELAYEKVFGISKEET